ncbi:type I pullulanase [Streptococcus sobrinus]|uniref:pullulanase n=1 Tax=Streptococcus sobrinus W1703 TaxID=1227275 RepID=U2J3U5_9STRE|nr:type I pullulanase [Streptococcus sobrinus]ERJ74722.1 pullulanase, type I [Streptococcus sobrinus W1703]
MLKNQITVHFHSRSEHYENYSMWKWLDGYWGEDAFFSGQDDFGLVGQINYPSENFVRQVGLLVKTTDWSSQTCDYAVRRFLGDAPNNIWIVEGDSNVYYSKQVALTSPLYTGQDNTAFDMGIRANDFDHRWAYQGWLGFRYQEKKTKFKIWSPLADRIYLLLYEKDQAPAKIIPMGRGRKVNTDHHELNTHGVWSVTVEGNLEGWSYQYRIYHEENFYQDTRDPYTRALSLDNKRSLIVSDRSLRPQGFSVKQGKAAHWRGGNACASVICELHVRDFTNDSSSGIEENLRGTFLGACYPRSHNFAGDSTGIDYIKSMGYSYIQLQPIFDHHKTYSDEGKILYNWGYDPENYNVPDRQFAMDQIDPLAPILEFKRMIQAYHDAGIGVIMDVVYNHTYSSHNSPFQLSSPYYYYRMQNDGSFQDGSGCGNETASEKEMFRKYMLDSILYWTEEYNIDGFRFDLMGLHDVDTMNLIRNTLDGIDQQILVYGEGWDMGVGLPVRQKAMKANADQLPRIAFFNDNARDAVKGREVYGDIEAGFVSGAPLEWEVSQALLGSQAFAPYSMPGQVLNYIEVHDNYNLHDLLKVLHPEDSKEDRKARVYLANALNLSMQGLCFMQLGQEFMRTKIRSTGGNGEITAQDLLRARNSYNAPDGVNAVNWDLVTEHQDLIEKIRKLVNFKKNGRELSETKYDRINSNEVIEENGYCSGIVKVTIKNTENKTFIFNNHEKSFNLY